MAATHATEGGKEAKEPPIDLLNDGPDLLENDFGDFTYAATEEAINTRRSFLPLTKGEKTSSDSNLVFAQLAH
jgi:hypothetical protein